MAFGLGLQPSRDASEAHDKITGKPLTVDKVAAEMLKSGVAVQAWISHFVIAPPLIIDKGDIDFGVSALDAALELADAQTRE
jgi:taurine---2-oxoglutarate transaminase